MVIWMVQYYYSISVIVSTLLAVRDKLAFGTLSITLYMCTATIHGTIVQFGECWYIHVCERV